MLRLCALAWRICAMCAGIRGEVRSERLRILHAEGGMRMHAAGGLSRRVQEGGIVERGVGAGVQFSCIAATHEHEG